MKTVRPLLLAAVLAPLVAWAVPQTPPEGPAGAGARGAEPKLTPEQRQERARAKLVKKTRLRRTLQIAEALELSDREAIRLSETLSRFDGQREALLERMMTAGMTLRRAARGDASAYGQIDQATSQFIDAKTALLNLDRQVLDTVAKEFQLTPDKKARLALSFGGRGHHDGFEGKRGGPRGPPR
jgi:hypothetical protein